MCNDYHRTVHGSDGSAAGGRYSDLSEWPRSIKSRKSVSPKILSGTATDIVTGDTPVNFSAGIAKIHNIFIDFSFSL